MAPTATIDHLLYLGIFAGAKVKRLYGYIKVPADWKGTAPGTRNLELGLDGKELLCFRKPFYSGRPGSVVAVEQNKDGTWSPKSVRWSGEWPHQEDLLRIQLRHDAQVTEQDAEAQRDKVGKRNVPFEALAPFRKEYRRLGTRLGQEALIARVTAWIRYGDD